MRQWSPFSFVVENGTDAWVAFVLETTLGGSAKKGL
jgi:hypothetical protein